MATRKTTVATSGGGLSQPNWMLDANGQRVTRGGGAVDPNQAAVTPGYARAFGAGDPDGPPVNGPPSLEQQGISDPRGQWTGWNEWASLWDSLKGGGANAGNIGADIADMGQNFSPEGGGIEGFRRFLEHPAWKHALAYSLKGTPQWKQMSEMKFPAEQLLSSGMGQIGAMGRQAIDQGMSGLQQSGLSRSPGAAAAVQRGARVSAGQAGAQLGATVGEKAYSAEMQRLGTMLSLEQAMQQIALGISPDRAREPSNNPGAGDYMALLGALAGAGATVAAACWVARAVYGEDNPRWRLFRIWLTLLAPRWFLKLYLRHGERFARWLKWMPWLKRPIRAWMERRIASMAPRELDPQCASI